MYATLASRVITGPVLYLTLKPTAKMLYDRGRELASSIGMGEGGHRERQRQVK